VDAAPLQPADKPLISDTSSPTFVLDAAHMDQLWSESDAASWGLERSDFDRILVLAAMRQNFGLPPFAIARKEEQSAFFRGVKLADLVLASACADGNERAWEHFMEIYGSQLTRAAVAISGSETLGRDLADAFYAELYGLTTREGRRKCPLETYRGRGSLIGWLRTTLSQRFVDHYRRTFREEPLKDDVHDAPTADSSPLPDSDVTVTLRNAIQRALGILPVEGRFVLAAYYLDGKTLAEIAKVLHVHEATISRKLKRTTEAVRKSLLKTLENGGMSRRAAQEALGTDPRDLELGADLKKLLQHLASDPFTEQIAPERESENLNVPESLGSSPTSSRASEANSER